jgi:hypothetical protein
MTQQNALVAIYSNPGEVQEAIKALSESGFDLERFSVVGKAYLEQKEPVAYYQQGEQMMCWGDLSDFWNPLSSMTRGWAMFRIPGITPLLAIGPLAVWIVAVLDNYSIFNGLSALGAAFYSMGIAKDNIHEYEEALRKGNYLVCVHGPALEVMRAKKIFKSAKIKLFN